MLTVSKGDIDLYNADQCPVTLQVKLKRSTLTLNKVNVDLKRNGESYYIMIGGTVVGIMNIALSKTVTNCNELGIRYKGKIVEENETVYARFQRTA